jgi:hypothetical protein
MQPAGGMNKVLMWCLLVLLALGVLGGLWVGLNIHQAASRASIECIDRSHLRDMSPSRA